ncbi:MAG: M48 family metalloprotease [Sphingomonadaceae bacterium]
MTRDTPPFARRLVCGAALLILLLANPALASPASEAPASFLRAEDHRVAKIAYRLAIAGKPFCPDHWPASGLLLHHLGDYEPEDRPVVTAQGLGEGPAILSVIADGPAAAAGLRAGDVLLAVNSRRLPDPAAAAAIEDDGARRAAIVAVERILEDALRDGPTELIVEREDKRLAVMLAPISACPLRIRLARSPQVNGFVKDDYVIMTTAMLAYARSDDELAIVIGHELAHVILRHRERLAAEKSSGLRGALGGNAARIWRTEEEADRLGLMLAWAAGYDLGAAIPFWRRFYGDFAKGGRLFRTHPSLAARERIIAETFDELRRLSERGPQRP